MRKRFEIMWLDRPKDGNYPAALSYLTLLFPPRTAARYVALLRRAPVTSFKSKDIFRASGLSLLGISNYFVERDRKKILEGQKLSPLLLVRDPANGRRIVAYGYHRLCSVYAMDA